MIPNKCYNQMKKFTNNQKEKMKTKFLNSALLHIKLPQNVVSEKYIVENFELKILVKTPSKISKD